MFNTASPALTLLLLAGALVAIGLYLVLERTLTRIVIGFTIIANGVNVLLLVAGGQAGRPPISEASADVAGQTDPLVQGLILTAIVITLGTTAFMLALAYRSWQLNDHDEVQDDLEDRRVARKAMQAAEAELAREAIDSELESEAAEARDETEGPGEEDEDEEAPR